MKSGRVLVFFLLTAVLVLAACGESTPVAFSDTTTSQPVTYTPKPSLIYTPFPTFTPPPSYTPDLPATATQIVRAATSSARSTQLSTFPPFPSGCHTDNYTISSNGEWIADNECYLPDSTLVVMNKSGTLQWVLHHTDYFPHPDFGDIFIDHWSNDNRYLYFSIANHGSGGHCYVGYDGGGFGLFRLNLQTGITTTLLPLRRFEYNQQDYKQYVWSFSPTGRRFIYEQTNNSIGLWDLYTGEVTSIQLPNDIIHIGGFLWSEDALQIIYTVTWLDNSERYHFKLYLTDLTTNSTHVVMTPPDEKCIWAPSWIGKDFLNIEIVDDFNFESYRVVFDINSNQIIGTPIPTPTP